MRALGADREAEPQQPLLAIPDAERAGWLAVQATIAAHLGVVLHQPARAPGAEGFLVRDAGQGQLALQPKLLRKLSRGGNCKENTNISIFLDIAPYKEKGKPMSGPLRVCARLWF